MTKKFFPSGGKGKPVVRETSVVQEEQQVAETVTQTIERHLAPGSHVSAQDIPLSRIRPNPFQSRQEFADEDIEELAESIRLHGFFGTLQLRSDPTEDGYFQLAYGERRWRAAHRVEGLDALPCRVVAYSDEQMEDIGLIENLQRKDLNPLEEASGLARKMQRINPATGSPYSIRSLAEHLGVKKNRVEEPLRLADIPADVQAMVRQRPDTMRSAFEIAKLPIIEMRQKLIELVLEKEANTRDIMYVVDQQLASLSSQEPPSPIQESSFSLVIASPGDNQQHIQGGQTEASFPEQKEVPALEKKQSDVQEGSPSSQKEVSSVPVVSLDPPTFRLERQRKQDIRVMDALLLRWSQWAETGEGDKGDMADRVAAWIRELEALYKKLS